MQPEKIRMLKQYWYFVSKIVETNEGEDMVWYFFYMFRDVQDVFSIAWFKRMGQKFKASRLTVTVKKHFICCC